MRSDTRTGLRAPSRCGIACAAAVVLALLSVSPSSASEESQALSARALIALQAGRTQEALDLLDKAVAADPADPDVRYQRGATRAKIGNYSGAIEDLRIAVAARPTFAPAALQLGVALTENGDYAEAERYLVQAQTDKKLDAQASFFLGLAQLRLSRLDEAQQNFVRARSGDESLAMASDYYLGVIAYRRHEYETAETYFTGVQRAKPESAMGIESRNFIAQMRRARRATYSVFGSVALEYDSNVTLGPSVVTPSQQQQGISEEGDGRFALNAGGRYVPWTKGPVALALSYEFFQSLHFDLTDFNLQDHRPAAQLTLDFDPILIGVLGRYDYYLLETDSFLQEATAFPWVSIREPGIGHTEVYYRMQWRDYKKKFIGDQQSTEPCTAATPDGCGFKQLDGFYNFVGVRQVVELGSPDRELWLGYQLGFNNMDDLGNDAYQYGEQQFEVALRWLLPYAVLGQAGYQYAHQDYSGASATLSPNQTTVRKDNDSRVVVAFERSLSELWEPLSVNAAWYGTFNNSNIAIFEYDRQIGSIGAEVRF